MNDPLAGRAVEVVTSRLEADPTAVHNALQTLSADERNRASRFAFDRDRRRFVLARAGLRTLLGGRLGIDPSAVEFCYSFRGKPTLAPDQAASGIHFNVSHSEDVAAYAFGERELGVDIEVLRTLPDADAVASLMFSSDENAEYRSLGAADRSAGFFNCWTRKEAFIKAIGQGLHYGLDRFDVSLAPGAPARILRVDDTPGEECGWALHDCSPEAGVIAAVVIRTGGAV